MVSLAHSYLYHEKYDVKQLDAFVASSRFRETSLLSAFSAIFGLTAV
jgi:hypothetical protein